MTESTFSEYFPTIEELNISDIPEDSVYIAAAGFEDRCFAFMEKCLQKSIKFNSIIGINYQPIIQKNNPEKFNIYSKALCTNRDIMWVTYDRHNPEAFTRSFNKIYPILRQTTNIIVDISGMSKFLIVVLFNNLKNYNGNIHVIYCEASIYHPTKEEYEYKKETIMEDSFPSFLTTNVFKIITTTELSSTSMQGYPLFLIVFPTFNYKDMYTLLNEITPQYLFKIEGKPKEYDDYWRLEALRWINEKLDRDFEPNIIEIYQQEVCNFNYVDTIKTLCSIYDKYKYTHKCIVTPTGTKLQALAVLFFKQIYPDIQLVYPVASEYLSEYTEGCKEMWHINIERYSEFMQDVSSLRKRELKELEKMLQNSGN